MKSFGFRCGYMAGNRSRFSKYYVTGSPIFSINFTNQSIKNSQAILKCFIDLKSILYIKYIKYFTLYTWERKRHAFRARRNGFFGGNFLFKISEYTQRERKCPFRKLQIFISQTTDSHFANYRFSFRKLQIFISQTTDFHFANYRFPFRFANYSKP